MSIKGKTKGFTLLEMLISLVVITVGVLGIYSAISKYSQNTQLEKENLIASYLCQEAIEIVKNRRDINWLQGASWDAGLTGCASGCEADYLADPSVDLPAWVDPGKDLYIEGATRSFRYLTSPVEGVDTKTNFKRRINIAAGVDELYVVVNVYWEGNVMSVEEKIYNWR
jgi:prepilin-type N-terminal cleavage/methylation domain-containing protein